MLRAAGRFILMLTLIATLVGAVSAAPDFQGAFAPAIVSFTATRETVDYAEVEAGKAEVSLDWSTINTNGQYLIALETYMQNTWVSLAGPNEALPLNGARTVTVMLPQNFGSPTYRLTLKTSMGQVIEQRFITLAYTTPAQDAPSIVSFTTMAKSVDTNLLVQSNARLVVSWEVANRTPDTLIRFEEVFADGSTVAVESPRHILWMPSKGSTALIPRATASKDPLVFRMSLVNINTGNVYNQSEITLPVVGNVVVAAQQTNTVQAANHQIASFSAESTTVAPGGNVVLNWDASGANSVQLLENVSGGGPTTLYIQLPPTGTMTLPVPEGAPDVTYTLHAQDANGETSTGELSVTSTGDTTSNGADTSGGG